MSETIRLYKVVTAEGKPCHGGSQDFTWPLPTQQADGSYEPGEWTAVTGTLSLCARGLHLTSEPAQWWMDSAVCFEAEYDGECVYEGGDIGLCVADWSIVGKGPDGKDLKLGGASSEVVRKTSSGNWVYAIDNPFGTV